MKNYKWLMRLIPAFICSVTLIGLVSCSSSRNIIPLHEGRMEQIILDYMVCEECIDGELEAIESLGTKALPYLQSILFYGAPRYLRSHTYFQCNILTTRVIRWATINGLEAPEFNVESELEILDGLFRSRAINAIESIGVNKSIRILTRFRRKIIAKDFIKKINLAIIRLQARKTVSELGNIN